MDDLQANPHADAANLRRLIGARADIRATIATTRDTIEMAQEAMHQVTLQLASPFSRDGLRHDGRGATTHDPARRSQLRGAS